MLLKLLKKAASVLAPAGFDMEVVIIEVLGLLEKTTYKIFNISI